MENLDSKMLEAALNGNLTTVEELVLKGANINYINAWGNFAAFSAAWDGNTKALDLLVLMREPLRVYCWDNLPEFIM